MHRIRRVCTQSRASIDRRRHKNARQGRRGARLLSRASICWCVAVMQDGRVYTTVPYIQLRGCLDGNDSASFLIAF